MNIRRYFWWSSPLIARIKPLVNKPRSSGCSPRSTFSCASRNSRARLRPTKQIVYRANKIILKIGPRPFALFAKNSWSVRQLSEKSRRPGGSRQRWLSGRATDISDRATDISDRATDLSVGQRVNAASIPNNLRRDNVVSDTDVIPREALFESEKYPVRS